MGQALLNQIAILHSHKELARKIIISDIADVFILRSTVRRNTFTIVR